MPKAVVFEGLIVNHRLIGMDGYQIESRTLQNLNKSELRPGSGAKTWHGSTKQFVI